MKKIARIALIALVLSSGTAADAATIPRVGASCAKVGVVVQYKSNAFTCKKVGVKKQWALVKKAAPKTSKAPATGADINPQAPTVDEFSNPTGDAVTSCQYSSNSSSVTGFGFPKNPSSRPSIGTIRGLMVFVDFKDISGTDNPAITGPKFTEKFEKFYFAQSYGKLNIRTDIHPTYLRIDKSSSSYGMGMWGKGDPGAYWIDGLKAAQRVANLSQYDFVVVMPPNNITTISYGPSFPGWKPPGFQNLKSSFGGVVGGSDQRDKTDSTGWIWLSHEVGHDLGFEHQYGYYPQPIWDLMDNVYIQTAPELFGWHRFMQGWLSDSQVLCLPRSSKGAIQRFRLDAIQKQNNLTKLALVKLDSSKLLGFELRQTGGFDNLPSAAEGVLVYEVHPTRRSNEQAIQLLKTSGDANRSGQLYASLKAGETLETQTHLITVSSIDATGALVTVSTK